MKFKLLGRPPNISLFSLAFFYYFFLTIMGSLSAYYGIPLTWDYVQGKFKQFFNMHSLRTVLNQMQKDSILFMKSPDGYEISENLIRSTLTAISDQLGHINKDEVIEKLQDPQIRAEIENGARIFIRSFFAEIVSPSHTHVHQGDLFYDVNEDINEDTKIPLEQLFHIFMKPENQIAYRNIIKATIKASAEGINELVTNGDAQRMIGQSFQMTLNMFENPETHDVMLNLAVEMCTSVCQVCFRTFVKIIQASGILESRIFKVIKYIFYCGVTFSVIMGFHVFFKIYFGNIWEPLVHYLF